MLKRLFFLFMKLGFISVGGGYPMMGLIYEQASGAVGLTSAEFADMAALELLASGPIVINSSTYIGYIKGGFPGSAAATLAVCIPSIVLTSIVHYFLSRFRDNRYVGAFLNAIKISCAGILATTAVNLAHDIFLTQTAVPSALLPLVQRIQWPEVLIGAGCLIALTKFKANPILVLLGAGAAGAAVFR